MKTHSEPPPSNWGVYFLAVVGALLLVSGMAWLLYSRTRPPALNQARIEERLKNLQDIRTSSAAALGTFGWQDETKGLVRLPVTNAMELIVREYKNPAAGRSNLLARVERANPPPPPKEPEKPTIFE